MKKIILILLAIFLLVSVSFADRDTPTIAGYSSTQLIKRGDWKIYRISFVATANNGDFAIYDATDNIQITDTYIKIEGSEATSRNGKPYDFTNKPLEGSTGLYLVINSGTVVIEYK